MKQVFGTLLFVFWMVLVCIGLGEPTEVNMPQDVTPSWVGWAYVILFIGSPFVFTYLLSDEKTKKS
jgi:hypothetical protein